MVNTKDKGDRIEIEAMNILDSYYISERITTPHDLFHLADLVGIKEYKPVIFVQCKNNRFTKKYKDKYSTWANRRIDDEHTVLEVWVKEDYQGWRMYRYQVDTDEWEKYFEIDVCNVSDMRLDWREAHIEYIS